VSHAFLSKTAFVIKIYAVTRGPREVTESKILGDLGISNTWGPPNFGAIRRWNAWL